jgi:hypothetical protein
MPEMPAGIEKGRTSEDFDYVHEELLKFINSNHNQGTVLFDVCFPASHSDGSIKDEFYQQSRHSKIKLKRANSYSFVVIYMEKREGK